MTNCSSWVECVAAYAEKQPSTTIFKCKDDKITYGDFNDLSRGFASFLKEKGVKKGDKVLCVTSQSISFFVVFAAAILCGAVFVPLEKDVLPDAVERIAEQLGAVKVFVSFDKSKMPASAQLFVNANDVFDVASSAKKIVFPMPEKDAVGQILWTTGTTGVAKGIVSANGQLCQCKTLANFFGYDENTIILVLGPLNHFGVMATALNAVVSGGAAVLSQGLTDFADLFKQLESGVNALYATPSAMNILFGICRDEIAEFSSRLRLVKLGGEKCSAETQRKMKEVFPESRLFIGYGSTEAGLLCGYEYSRFGVSDDSVGLSFPEVSVFVLDDDGNVLPDGKQNVGRIAAKTPFCMQGYLGGDTSKVLHDGYAWTDDLGYVDGGFLHVVGRAGNVIISGGLKINPYEVESAASECAEVCECVCVGKPDDVLGKRVCLYLSAVGGSTLSEAKLKSFLCGKLESYKVPRDVIFVEEIKHSANGKIDRKFYSAEAK